MPLLAEIADKMPTLREVWTFWTVIGLAAGGITVVLALMNLWIGAAAVEISVGIGMFTFVDRSLDDAIVHELGRGYLAQNKVSAFVPVIFASIGWGFVAWRSRGKIKDARAP